MALSREQVTHLLSAVCATREREIDCDACLAGMAEFAEAELVDAEVPEALSRIRDHIAFCPECAEEYELLGALLQSQFAI